MNLYKYVVADRFDILQNKQIRFTQPTSFNDPFELQPFLSSVASPTYFSDLMKSDGFKKDYNEKLLELIEKNLPQNMHTYKDQLLSLAREINLDNFVTPLLDQINPIFRSTMFEGINNSIGILSLCENPDSLLMWAHYSNSHTGFVIEFDMNHNFFSERLSSENSLHGLKKIIYCHSRPALILMDDVTEAIKTDEGKFINDIFFTKSSEWKYEKEWRMLNPLKDATTTFNNNGEDIFLFDIEPKCIKRIIFGCRTEEPTEIKIKKIINESTEFSHIKTCKSLIDQKEFKLNIVEKS
ncbi:MAG: DUF2971 domain-containing protein [Calditrichaceae bacterium]